MTVLTSMMLNVDDANSSEILIDNDLDPRISNSPSLLFVKQLFVKYPANIQKAISTLANGNYQFCSQPPPRDLQKAAGVCFNFVKKGDRVDGYYAYPRSGDLICIRGKVKSNMITGEALAISWPGSEWVNIPKTAFEWDEEGHLVLKDGQIMRTSKDQGGRTDWILFRYAVLDAEGFYRYNKSRLTSPSQLCKW